MVRRVRDALLGVKNEYVSMREFAVSGRGQSEVLGYVLSLALVSVLIGGAVISGQTLLENQDTIRTGGQWKNRASGSPTRS